MKTLYVSDLDKTLLRNNQRTSAFTNNTINSLVEKGMLFSYATARSYVTAHKATLGLNAQIPLIVYNGTFVIDNATGEILISNYLNHADELLSDVIDSGIYPIVYSYINGSEKFSYYAPKCSSGTMQFIKSRKNDIRENCVNSEEELYKGDIFYMTCIDDECKLKMLYEKYKGIYNCLFYKEPYSDEWWLEIMPKQSSKANAIKQLKEYLEFDRVVAFGDGENDIEMFEAADECYAVENAVENLKQIATGVIADNDSDAVAKWLLKNTGF